MKANAIRPIVFAGPSIYSLNSADIPTSIDLAPPAASGDLMRAVVAGRKVVGLIDGTFEQGPAVWHKEIIFALSEGCQVFGAASIGALRAAECHPFGMVGLGRVFEDYRSGCRSADADVAVVHGPAALGFPPLSLSLVDLEAALEALTTHLSRGEHDAILGRARAGFFKFRTWEYVLDIPDIPSARRVEIVEHVKELGSLRKAQDAALLLRRVAIAMPPIDPPGVAYVETNFMAALRNRLEI